MHCAHAFPNMISILKRPKYNNHETCKPNTDFGERKKEEN